MHHAATLWQACSVMPTLRRTVWTLLRKPQVRQGRQAVNKPCHLPSRPKHWEAARLPPLPRSHGLDFLPLHSSFVKALLTLLVTPVNLEATCVLCCAVLCLAAQSSPTLCDLMDSSPPGFSVHGDSPGKKTGVGSLSLLQRIFPTQESNWSLPHCKRILYQLSYQGSLLPVWLAGSCTWICPASNILKHPHLLCIDLPLGAYFLLRTDDCSVGWAPPNGRNPHCLILIHLCVYPIYICSCGY